MNLKYRYAYAYSLFVLLHLFSASVSANALTALLNQPSKPTMKQIRDAMIETGQYQPTSGQQLIGAGVPQMIALMDFAYPGAIYMPLGRDGARWGDLLDAFFLSIGQEGRVRRIELSGNSFSGNDDQMVAEYITQLGFDAKNIENSRPMVLIDRTGYGEGSQSTRVVSGVYKHFMQTTGRPAAELLPRFSLMSSGGGDPRILKGEISPAEFFLSISDETNRRGRPSSIIHVPNASHWTDGTLWHGHYSPPTRLADGRWVPVIAVPTEGDRTTILNELVGFINMAADPAFLAAVQAEAKKLGYEYPLGEYKPEPLPSPEELEKRRLEILKESLLGLKTKLGPKGEQTKYLSSNGEAYHEWLEQAVTLPNRINALTILFIKELEVAVQNKTIGERDYRRLVARAIAHMQLPDEKLNERFSNLVASSELLRSVLVDKRDVFAAGKRPDAKILAANFLALERDLLCKEIIAAQATDKPATEEAAE